MAAIKGKQLATKPNGVDTANINAQAVTSAEVDSSVVIASGANPFTGDQSLGGHKLTSVQDPSGAQDAATKAYVDAVAAGAKVKAPVLVVATANVAVLIGEQTIDGVLTSNSRVLLVGQGTGAQNGFWVTAAGAWARPSDFSNGSSAAGALTVVEEGTANADTQWICTTNPPSDIVGADALTFVKFANPFVYTFTNGVMQSGSTVSVQPDGGSLSVSGSGVKVVYAAPSNVGTANAAGSADTAAASDHVHNSPIAVIGVSDVACSATVSDGDQATSTTVPKDNFGGGKPCVLVNGVYYAIGNGVKTKSVYVSGDGGATARAWSAIVAGDTIRWVGSVAGFQLAATDRLDMDYLAFS